MPFSDYDRLNALQDLIEGADFAYGDADEKRPVVLLRLPEGVRVGADIRKFADEVLLKEPRF